MKVSVVIPTYNRDKELARCLSSLVKQSFKNFEVLVCDDGSNDETEQVVRLYSKQIPINYHYTENSGRPAVPRNLCWRLAKSDYIAYDAQQLHNVHTRYYGDSSVMVNDALNNSEATVRKIIV